MDKGIKGCAFICDSGGVIQNILRNDFKQCNQDCYGKPFTSLLEKGSMEKALNMVMETKQKNIAFDYRLNLQHESQIKSLYFMGVNLGEQLLIIGADNHKEAVGFTGHLHQINNEQSNQIRSLLKENIKLQNQPDQESEDLFDELSRVNNELVNLQRELNKKNKELEKLNELKNRFMGIASHDLRNPLHVIQMYTELLLEDITENLTEKQIKFLKTIFNSTQFMVNLTDDLLEYTKIEAGKIELNKQLFDFAILISNITDFIRPIAEKKNIQIEVTGTEKALIVNADMFKIEQVLNNLLGNAVKFSYQESTINFHIADKDDIYYFYISNKGDGIPLEQQERLFKPFQKIAQQGTGKEKGSGLGLFIVKQVIDNHKGKIWVESQVGKDTTFFIELPKK